MCFDNILLNDLYHSLDLEGSIHYFRPYINLTLRFNRQLKLDLFLSHNERKIWKLNIIFQNWEKTIFSSLLANSDLEFESIWKKAGEIKEEWKEVLYNKIVV